ncbi:MAG: TlpA family protein disulfide reductase [Flavobacteriaceae bacterium]|nr:TlpA family protein disulfide reductase [Flavobacteriaceae bacterium]
MRKIQLFFCVAILFVSCKEEGRKDLVKTDSIPSYNYAELAPLLSKNDGKTYVINFWATWCAPCVKELPAFEKLLDRYKGENVKVLLVSLDFPSQIESKLIPFIKKNQLKSQVVLMNDPDQDSWIPKISKNWSGAIPATLIYNSKKRVFYERSFEYAELENELQKFLN